jgi:hypothetical protein
MNQKGRNIWHTLGLALAYTAPVSFTALVVITVVGALDDAFSRIQSVGLWWLIFPFGYALSLSYFIFEPNIRLNRERDKVVDALILYWKELLEKQSKPQPSSKEIEYLREMLIERVKVWAWFDSELWSKHFPDEQYSKFLFGLVDNFAAYWQHQKNKVEKK